MQPLCEEILRLTWVSGSYSVLQLQFPAPHGNSQLSVTAILEDLIPFLACVVTAWMECIDRCTQNIYVHKIKEKFKMTGSKYIGGTVPIHRLFSDLSLRTRHGPLCEWFRHCSYHLLAQECVSEDGGWRTIKQNYQSHFNRPHVTQKNSGFRELLLFLLMHYRGEGGCSENTEYFPDLIAFKKNY